MKGPDVSYVDLLDVMTTEHSASEEQQYASGAAPLSNPLRPSSSGKCTRELAFALMEFTRQTYYPKGVREPEVTRLLSIGHYVEAQIIEQFEKYTADFFKVKYKQHSVDGFKVTSEEYPQIAGTIEGSLDWVFWSPETRGLIDAKSKKDKFHRFFSTDWESTTDKLSNMQTVTQLGSKGYYVEDVEAFIKELKDPFFEQNFWQLNFYANTDWALNKGIDHASILQYNKNDSRMREIRFKPSRQLYERTRLKFQAAADAASAGQPELAPRDFFFGSIKCAFCDYKTQCWADKKKDAKQEYFDTNFPTKKWPTDAKKLGKELNELYKEYVVNSGAAEKCSAIEEQILKVMEDNKIEKVKFEDGRVYEKKFLKTPRPHFSLRRTKL